MFFYKFFYNPRKFFLPFHPQPVPSANPSRTSSTSSPSISVSLSIPSISPVSLNLYHILTPSPPSKQALSPYALAHHQNVRLYSTQTQFSLQ